MKIHVETWKKSYNRMMLCNYFQVSFIIKLAFHLDKLQRLMIDDEWFVWKDVVGNGRYPSLNDSHILCREKPRKNMINIHQRSWPSWREWSPRPTEYQARMLTIHSVSNNMPVSAVKNIKVPEAFKIAKVDVNIILLHIFTLKNGRFKTHLSCLDRSIIELLVAFQGGFHHLGSPFFQRLYQKTLCKHFYDLEPFKIRPR